jgi:hypothetical protein
VLVSALLQGEHLISQPTRVVDDSDAYAVYASILPIGFSSGHKGVSRVALLQETRPKFTCPREETIGPEWREAWQNYKKENASVRTLLPTFDLGVPYSLVSLAEVKSLLRQAGHDGKEIRGGWSEAYAGFPNGKLLTVSAVGFDTLKTRAIVTLQYNCGLSIDPRSIEYDCHGGWQIALLRVNGRWVLPDGNVPGCVWIA